MKRLAGLSLIGIAAAIVVALTIYANAASVGSISANNLVLVGGDAEQMIEDKIEALEEQLEQLDEVQDEDDMFVFVSDEEEFEEDEFEDLDDELIPLLLLGLLH